MVKVLGVVCTSSIVVYIVVPDTIYRIMRTLGIDYITLVPRFIEDSSKHYHTALHSYIVG